MALKEMAPDAGSVMCFPYTGGSFFNRLFDTSDFFS
jgi:hypothetical protein